MVRFGIILISMTFLCSCLSEGKRPLEGKIYTIELSYVAWANDSNSWALGEGMALPNDPLILQNIFIEPQMSSLMLPDSLGYHGDVVRFKGRFFKANELFTNRTSFKYPDDAKVFRYSEYEVLKSNHLDE